VAFSAVYSSEQSYDVHLAVLLSASGAVRIVYSVPSAVLGVLGNRKAIAKFIGINASGFLLQIVAFVGLINLGAAAPISMAFAVLITWLLRALGGAIIAWDEIRAER